VLLTRLVVGGEGFLQNRKNDLSGNGKRWTGSVGHVVQHGLQGVQYPATVALGVEDQRIDRLYRQHVSLFPFPGSRLLDRPLDHHPDVLVS